MRQPELVNAGRFAPQCCMSHSQTTTQRTSGVPLSRCLIVAAFFLTPAWLAAVAAAQSLEVIDLHHRTAAEVIPGQNGITQDVNDTTSGKDDRP